MRIVSDHHVLQTVSSNKIYLSAFDNKRSIIADGVHTLPFGHYEALDYCSQASPDLLLSSMAAEQVESCEV